MEQAKKHLKLSSIVVIVFAVASFLKVLADILYGDIKHANVPAGSPENIILITQIILAALSLIFLIPQIFLGIKGLLLVKNPTSSKKHLVWAYALFVITVIKLVITVINYFKSGSAGDNITEILALAVELSVFADYIAYSKKLAEIA